LQILAGVWLNDPENATIVGTWIAGHTDEISAFMSNYQVSQAEAVIALYGLPSTIAASTQMFYDKLTNYEEWYDMHGVLHADRFVNWYIKFPDTTSPFKSNAPYTIINVSLRLYNVEFPVTESGITANARQ
jgi:hypothetical protein